MAQAGAWILGRGIKGWNEGLGMVPEDQNQEKGNGEGVTKTWQKNRRM